MAEIKSCGVLIFRTDPKRSFLLMRHPTRWDLPKGHIDGAETDLECALRELHEETGISESDITIDLEFRFVHEYVVNNHREGNIPKLKQLVVYLAELLNPVEITPTEHEGFEWFDWHPPHQIQSQTIDGLLAHLQSHWKH